MKKSIIFILSPMLILAALVYGAERIEQFPAGIKTTLIKDSGNATIDGNTTHGGNTVVKSTSDNSTSLEIIRPETYGAVGDNATTDDFGAISSAISNCPTTGCVISINRAYRLSDDVSIPVYAELYFNNSGMLVPDSGKVVTFASPKSIVAHRNQRIFRGNGTVVFTGSGIVYPEFWGADNTGTSDSSATVEMAVTSIPVGSTLSFGAGTFLVDDTVTITKGISIACDPGEATTLKAGSSMTGKSMLVYYPSQPYADMRRIENCKLDGDDKALNGIEVLQAYGLTIQDVKAKQFVGSAFLANGDSANGDDHLGGYVYNLIFQNCIASDSAIGYRIWTHKNMNAFTGFQFVNSGAYLNTDVGLLVQGDNSTTYPTGDYPITGTNVRGPLVNWFGGQLEWNTGTSVKLMNGAFLNMSGAYIEPHGGIGFNLAGRSIAEITSGFGPYDNSVFSDNSTMCYSNAVTSVAYRLGQYAPLGRSCIGDRISDRLTYGPPNWGFSPYTGGYWWWKGMTLTDSSGNRWMSLTERGKAGEAGKLKYAPIDGRVIIPFDNETLNDNGYWLAYWNEGDFVVTGVDLIVEEAFTGTEDTPGECVGYGWAKGIHLGTTTYREKFINVVQAGEANLTAGAVIRAWDNNDTDSVLYWKGGTDSATGSHKAYFMNGVSSSDRDADWDTIYDNSYIYVYSCPRGGTDGTWTHGKGYIVITGYPLEFN